MLQGSVLQRMSAAAMLRELAYARECGVPVNEVELRSAVEALAAIFPFDCVMLARWDPLARRHTTLASIGYPKDALSPFEELTHAPRNPSQARTPKVHYLSDVRPNERVGPVFSEVIDPLGFSDGISVCLRSGSRCVGALHASAVRPDSVDNTGVVLLGIISHDLATLVDPIPPDLAWAVNRKPHESVGRFIYDLTNDKCIPLNAAARVRLVEPMSPLRQILRARDRRWVSSLTALADHKVIRIDVTRAGQWCLLEHRVEVPPRRLTFRELEVLAEVAKGMSNHEVAVALNVSEWTIVTHLEHILAKLGVTNRTAAAVEASKLGLIRMPVESQLWDHAHTTGPSTSVAAASPRGGPLLCISQPRCVPLRCVPIAVLTCCPSTTPDPLLSDLPSFSLVLDRQCHSASTPIHAQGPWSGQRRPSDPGKVIRCQPEQRMANCSTITAKLSPHHYILGSDARPSALAVRARLHSVPADQCDPRSYRWRKQ
jgi:DNA-binding CsgD family transcriptional regulator